MGALSTINRLHQSLDTRFDYVGRQRALGIRCTSS
jgi:hypothetical protein